MLDEGGREGRKAALQFRDPNSVPHLRQNSNSHLITRYDYSVCTKLPFYFLSAKPLINMEVRDLILVVTQSAFA